MPPPQYFRRSQTYKSGKEAPDIFRLWLLRMLVPLGAHREFITQYGFKSDALAELLGLGRWVEGSDDADVESDTWSEDSSATSEKTTNQIFEPKRVRNELRRLYRTAERKASAGHLPQALRSNLERLASLVGLSAVDVSILEFAVMINSDGLLVETSEWLGNLSTVKLIHALSVVLDLPENSIREAISSKSVLARTALVICVRTGADTFSKKFELVSDEFADRILSGETDPVDLLYGNVMPCPPPQLKLSDYPHVNATLSIALPYLRHAIDTQRKGVNLFVYGAPGTGKTQLARALADELGCELFQVTSEDADGDAMNGERRLPCFRAAQSILAKRRVMIAFDEAADVFDDGDLYFGRKSTAQTRKAWINRTLEENPVPTLWLSNNIACLDPAFVRRFDMVIELGIPPRQQRQRILVDLCGDLLDECAMARIAESEVLAPAVAARAASVVRCLTGELGAPASGYAVERLIGNTLQAQGHRAILRNDPNRLPETYDPAFLHADADLSALADGLARSGQARLCLYGPSGTGKTAYARWVAGRLGVPLHVRRGSDLMSMWLGESEKQIAKVFQQAEQDKALLLIDEVDGFLQDRRSAQRSWEVTLVNEMLTQMESYSGIFIASTNLMEGLEPAALRRFDLKVKFDFLKPEQAWELLARQCHVFSLAPPEPMQRATLDRLTHLTPGDFAAVARQHRFRSIESTSALLAALTSECALKQGARSGIGFV